MSYDGQRKDGKRHGKGTYKFDSGNVYVGDWYNDKMHGKGVFTWKNGDTYEGDMFEGDFHGTGKKKWAKSGNTYEGGYKHDKMHGKGIFHWSDGSRYEGEMTDGDFEGYGIRYFKSGNRYEGQWKKDKMHGRGTFYWKNGDRYEGDLFEGDFHGKGVKYFAKSGNRYEGEYNHDQMHGYGTFTWASGGRYVGEMRNGDFNGKGVKYDANGDRWEGIFKDDNKDGPGVFYYADGRSKAQVYSAGTLVSEGQVQAAGKAPASIDMTHTTPVKKVATKLTFTPTQGTGPDVFISLRFGEALDAGTALKDALEKEGFKVFLCAVQPGGDLMGEIVYSLDESRMVIIMGSETYGQKTDSAFSTHEELKFIVQEKKPMFVVKMCQKYKDALARFHLGDSVSYHPWSPSGDEVHNIPEDLTQAIIRKFQSLKN